jgi:hypothetical protein
MTAALVNPWKVAGRIGSKLLANAMPDLVSVLKRDDESAVSAELKELLLSPQPIHHRPPA